MHECKNVFYSVGFFKSENPHHTTMLKNDGQEIFVLYVDHLRLKNSTRLHKVCVHNMPVNHRKECKHTFLY